MRRFAVLLVVATACTGAGDAEPSDPPPTSVTTTSTTVAIATPAPSTTRMTTGPTAETTTTSTTVAPVTWERLAGQRFPRSEMPAVTIDGLIYVLGGFMETARGAEGAERRGGLRPGRR